MNTIYATPQLSLSDRVTLVLQRYPLVNLPCVQIRETKKAFAYVVYGKQTLPMRVRGFVGQS